tara:strand:+ start:1741 stop:2562 length:822 start_codon:yes stop_codon:yes gene_type:complete
MHKLFLFFFILISHFSFSQNQYDLIGALFVEDVRPISYRLIFEEENQQINGYSITGIGTDFETKSELSGKFVEDSLFLTEFQVLSTLSEDPISNFCFIDLKAKLKGSKKKQSFEGVFVGRFLDGKECAAGKVVFADKAKLEKKMKQVQKVQELIGDRKQEKKLVKLASDETYEVFWYSDKFKIHLWDSSLEDDDRITLIINGELVLDNEVMRSKKKKISHVLQKGTNIIELIAENEGRAPHNTTRVELIDDKTKHAILSQLEVGKKVTFKIIH